MITKALAILLLFALQAAALAQAPTGGPPMPRTPDRPTTWLYWIVIAVLAGATVTISIMPSKRGHQD